MNIKLSFCIPTYNRADFIGETIESIISQANDEIEIVISDNASTDNTNEVVRKYQRLFPQITYFRSDKNLGADWNYLKVVELAKGKYCWLMGSDDKIVNGAVNKVLHELKDECEIYLLSAIPCDPKMKRIINSPSRPINSTKDRIFNLYDKNSLLNYFKSVKLLGGLFSYISTIIFKREKWLSINFNKLFIGSAYAHTFILLNICKQYCMLKYLIKPLVLCRTGYDSFMERGRYKRIMLDIEGYERLSEVLFKDYPDIQHEIKRVLWNAISLKRLLTLKMETYNCNSKNREGFQQIWQHLLINYREFKRFFLKMILARIIPVTSIRILYHIKRHFS